MSVEATPTSSSVIERKSASGQTRMAMDRELPGFKLKPSEMAEAARAPIDYQAQKTQDTVDKKTAEASALATLAEESAKLQAFADSGRGLNPVKGVSDIFRSRIGATLVNDGSNAGNHVVISGDGDVPVREFKLTIAQVASKDQIISNASARLTSPTDPITLTDGNLILNGQDVALTNGMSLEDVRDAINTQVGESANVSATIVEGFETIINAGVPESTTVYRLELTCTESPAQRLTVSDNQGEALKGALPFAMNSVTPMGASGTFTINGQSLEVDSSMTIYDVKNAIESLEGSGVSATIDTFTSGDLRLRLIADEEGSPISLANTVGSPLSALGLANSGKTALDLSAVFTIDGVTYQRSSNVVTDLMEGVKLQMVSPTSSDQVITCSIENDLNTIAKGIEGFVKSLQEIEAFYKEQSAKNADGTPKEGADLVGNRFLKSFMEELQDAVQLEVPGMGGNNPYRHAPDIGISFKDYEGDTSLELDTKVLYKAIESDPQAVQKLLSFDFSSSQGDLRMLDSPKQLSAAFQGRDIQLSVLKESIDGDTVVRAFFTVDDQEYEATIDTATRTVTGVKGDAFAETVLYVPQSLLDNLVTDGGAETRTFSVTQGIFDRVGVLLSEALRGPASNLDEDESNYGGLMLAQKTVADKKTDLEARLEKLEAKANEAYEKMLDKIERLRAVLEMLESISSQIKAFTDTGSNR